MHICTYIYIYIYIYTYIYIYIIGWQASAGADGGAAPGKEQLLAMLALCDMFRLFGPARAGTDRDEAERWRGALEGTGERGLHLWADLAQHAIDRKVKAVWWLSHYGLLESESSCWSRMPSVWYEPAADMSRSGGGWGVLGAGTGGVGMDAPGAVCVLQRLLVRVCVYIYIYILYYIY